MVIHGSDGLVEFRFLRPGARQVCLAGDFNRWQGDAVSMQKGEGGWWSARLDLSPGVYQFRYQADGDWFNDYAAFGLEMGPFGWNSVVLIEERLQGAIGHDSAVEPTTETPGHVDVPIRKDSAGLQSPTMTREAEDRQAA